MRYIGNKENVVPRIDEILTRKHITGESLFDFFLGNDQCREILQTDGISSEYIGFHVFFLLFAEGIY